MPEKFSSEQEIVRVLDNTDFTLVESFNTLSVRGIQEIAYYSCDEEIGYLKVQTHKRLFVYKNVDINTWNEFRFANSIESYYEKKIKYDFVLL